MSPQPVGADLPPQVHGRKATWFELFFDLVFVVAVAQLSGAYAHHFDWTGAAGSALLLLAMWWCWLGHTFHATRFDEQRRDQRLLGLVQIVAVTVIAYGVSDAYGARGPAFALGLAAFKTLLAVAYLREWRWHGAHRLIRAYSALYLLQAALWAASVALPPTPRGWRATPPRCGRTPSTCPSASGCSPSFCSARAWPRWCMRLTTVRSCMVMRWPRRWAAWRSSS
jgi:low temperature requirement protein LtrA